MKLIIDSNNRDKTIYPGSNKFRYNIIRQYQLNSVRLESAQIMSSDYVINSHNNTLSITLSSVVYVCTLRKGTWSASDYATILQTDLNDGGKWDTDPTLTFTVAYDSNTNKYTIGSSSAININYQISSKLASKLGYSHVQTNSSTSHVSDKRAQFFNSRYYNIVIPQLQRESTEGMRRQAFARVYNNVNPNELINYHEYFYKNITHKFNNEQSPDEIDVEVYDENNDLVVLDTELVLEIIIN